MRLLVHWQDFPGYAADCLEAYRRQSGAEILVVFDSVNDQVQYRRAEFPFEGTIREISGWGIGAVDALVGEWGPDVVLVGGWRGYGLKVGLASARRGFPVIAMSDNVYRGRIRAAGLGVYFRTVLRRLHRGYWVPGRRARRYLERCGVPRDQIREGMYAVDIGRYRGRAPDREDSHRRFLYAGRLSPEKGVHELLEAFSRYDGAWHLRLCGTGPLATMAEEYADADPRVETKGFLQPSDLAREMRDADALVLPSRREPWGVVILEGAAAGLPILCTDACGASEDLVEDGDNGLILPSPLRVRTLRAALARFASFTRIRRRTMGGRSRQLAESFDTGRWAETLDSWTRALVA